MAKGSGGSVIKGVLIVLASLVLVAGILFAVWYFTGGFGGKITAMGVKIGDEVYHGSKNGFTIQSGEEIGVDNPFGGEYEVKVTANARNDFEFYAGDDLYEWSDINGEDITHCFNIVKSESSFTLTYKDFYKIAEDIFGDEVQTAEEVSGDIFMLEISASNATLRFGFGIGTIGANLTAKGLQLNAHDYDF